MIKVRSVRALEDYRLEIGFTDGTSGTLSLKNRLFGPMFEPLRDPSFFVQVALDEYGVISWPNGADLAPDGLYVEIRNAAVTAAKG
jgi:hypothetical protein